MELLSWGANSHGQLGQGIISDQCNTPQHVIRTWDLLIKNISSGGGHSLLLDVEGQVFGCGWNQQKQLGCETKQNNDSNVHTFTKIWDLSGITFRSLCAGWDSSAGITEKDVLFLWGSNSYGQLGLPKDHFPKYLKPIQLELRAKSITMGMRHTILVDINGFVWATGNGKHGQLGLGDDITSSDTFKKLLNINNIESAKCGQHHTIAWSKRDKLIYSWGDNNYGQIGLECDVKRISTPITIKMLDQFVDQILNIHCGWTHSAVLLNDGRAIYWGRNNYGQLGCTKLSNNTFNIVSINGNPIKELSVGSEHSVCILEDDTVWSWGWNEHGNTGTGNDQNVTEPQCVNINSKVKAVYSGAANNFVILS